MRRAACSPGRDEPRKFPCLATEGPGDGDVVQNVIAREAFALPVERACDEVVTQQVLVEEPSGEADR